MTLTLDWVILHTIMHYSSTFTYIPNFIKIKETFSGRTDVRTFKTHFIRSTRSRQPKNHLRVRFRPFAGMPPRATGLNFRMLGHTAGENSRAKFCHNRFRDFGVLLPAIFPFFIAESEISPICWDAPLGRSA